MSVLKQVTDMIGGEVWKNSMRSSDAINKLPNAGQSGFMTGVPEAIFNYRKQEEGGKDIFEAVKSAHMSGDKMDYAKIAGSAMVAGAAYRVASGGGAYRDSNGNTDVAGIPFI